MSGIHTSASSDYLPYLDLPEIPRTIQDPTPSLDERTQTVSLRRFSPIFFCAGEHEAFFTTSSRSSAPITPISPLLLRKQASSQELPLPSVSIDRQSTSQELVDYTSESRQKIFFNKRKSIITNQDGEIISFDNLSPETIEGIIDTYFENDHEKYFRLSHESKISIIYDVIQLQNLANIVNTFIRDLFQHSRSLEEKDQQQYEKSILEALIYMADIKERDIIQHMTPLKNYWLYKLPESQKTIQFLNLGGEIRAFQLIDSINSDYHGSYKTHTTAIEIKKAPIIPESPSKESPLSWIGVSSYNLSKSMENIHKESQALIDSLDRRLESLKTDSDEIDFDLRKEQEELERQRIYLEGESLSEQSRISIQSEIEKIQRKITQLKRKKEKLLKTLPQQIDQIKDDYKQACDFIKNPSIPIEDLLQLVIHQQKITIAEKDLEKEQTDERKEEIQSQINSFRDIIDNLGLSQITLPPAILRIFKPIANEHIIAEQLKDLEYCADYHGISSIYLDEETDNYHVSLYYKHYLGTSLQKLPNSDTAFQDLQTKRQFIDQLTAGLEELHKKQFIHRDIKPANIVHEHHKSCFIDFDTVIDFSRPVSNDIINSCKGTRFYLPLEVLKRFIPKYLLTQILAQKESSSINPLSQSQPSIVPRSSFRSQIDQSISGSKYSVSDSESTSSFGLLASAISARDPLHHTSIVHSSAAPDSFPVSENSVSDSKSTFSFGLLASERSAKAPLHHTSIVHSSATPDSILSDETYATEMDQLSMVNLYSLLGQTSDSKSTSELGVLVASESSARASLHHTSIVHSSAAPDSILADETYAAKMHQLPINLHFLLRQITDQKASIDHSSLKVPETKIHASVASENDQFELSDYLAHQEYKPFDYFKKQDTYSMALTFLELLLDIEDIFPSALQQPLKTFFTTNGVCKKTEEKCTENIKKSDIQTQNSIKTLIISLENIKLTCESLIEAMPKEERTDEEIAVATIASIFRNNLMEIPTIHEIRAALTFFIERRLSSFNPKSEA